MAHLEPEQKHEDEPLDPVMENVRRKMVRLQIVASGIIIVSLMAVLFAVVYKVRSRAEAEKIAAPTSFAVPADQPLAARATLPAGFEIQSVSHSGSQILFWGTLNGQKKALIFDIAVGRVVADIAVTNQ
ncbi:hypothetical protein ACFSE1_09570 [Rhizobium helianthi]|uniref:Fimbrial protein n=1 Tax=Rhizobium helianthi TaxID=1132695 RepID=A0ABW4M3I7_9HYPH